MRHSLSTPHPPEAEYVSGYWQIVCPACGKEPRRGDVHCVADQFWHCFVCGASGKVTNLPRRAAVILQDKPVEFAPSWLGFNQLVEVYEAHPRRFEICAQHKNLTREVVERARIGVGVLPDSRCKHERIIVPILDDGLLVGLRGRAIGCDCPKWLAPAGFSINRLEAPYNHQQARRGDTLIICENMIDALMVSAPGQVAVATMSVSYWRDEWSAWVANLRPDRVVIMYDNDLPGNGGSPDVIEALRAEWESKKNRGAFPISGARRVQMALLDVGIKAEIFDWTGYGAHADIGSVFLSP